MQKRCSVSIKLKNDLLYDYIKSLLGLPYRWGGSNPIKGFDCSGLVIECFQAIGILKHGYDNTSQGLHDEMLGRCLKIVENPPFGAVCFFGKNIKEVGHVGLSLGCGLMVEAGGGDKHTTDKGEAGKRNAFVRIRPYNYRKDYLYSLTHAASYFD